MGINVRLVDTHLYCCILEGDPNNRERKCMSIQRQYHINTTMPVSYTHLLGTMPPAGQEREGPDSYRRFLHRAGTSKRVGAGAIGNHRPYA